MGTAGKIAVVALIVVVSLGIIGGCVGIGINNKEIRLRNTANAQQENLKVVYDKTWKVIQQQAQVSDKYAEDFKKIYIPLMEKRYGSGGGGLMKWIQERNPEFTPALYTKLMNSIEGLRGEFANEQKKLLDIKRQHDDMRLTFPSSLICGGRPELDIQLVTSARTSKAFETGEENEVDLFQKGEPKAE